MNRKNLLKRLVDSESLPPPDVIAADFIEVRKLKIK
jgi:hypothetical protein